MRDLNEYEVVVGDCKNCVECELQGISCCDRIFKFISPNINCLHNFKSILKKKVQKKWAQCTKENTKVGDTVRYIEDRMEYEVKYIHDSKEEFLLEAYSSTDIMSNFEIEIEV